MTGQGQTVRLRVSPEVAKIVGKEAPREVRLMAARGAIPLQGQDLATALFFLYHSGDPELRRCVMQTLTGMPAGILVPVVRTADLHPQLLDFIARMRPRDLAVLEPLLANPAVSATTLTHFAASAEGAILSLIACNDLRLAESPEIVEAILANPHADRALKFRLGWTDPAAAVDGTDDSGSEEAGEGGVASEDADAEEGSEEPEAAAEEEVNQSKYQMSLEMGVSEKIKMALTGDKEWRNIFIKDANKLVSAAVMKNPRITDGEVLTIAKSKTTSEELIRLITLNREWLKHYEVKKALVMHPRTPLPKALRFMSILSEKDLKSLAKSRNVAQVIVNNARRMLMVKEKKG